ncbi:MAG TPA: carotenoid biosynthesis protein [Bacteroidales bacterium]|jgi:putative membrane protein|nr:carotenoid biosynthesis protein [Bacteroidales bacterium]HRS18777.1 carotenoid biosynthesis protein [Bacteroidales bacterium]
MPIIHIPYIKSNNRILQLMLISFFTIGTIGFLYPATKQILITLIPYVLLGNFILVALFDSSQNTKKQLLVYAIIFLLGLGIEIIGVNTSIIFGTYWYGKALGIQVVNTPLLIGLNWLFLVYSTRLLFQSFTIHPYLKIIGASGSMLLYDFFLEQSAHKMDMWYWHNNTIPIQNYIAWFIISVCMHTIVNYAQITISNSIAKTIVYIQFVFFIILFIGLS